MKLAVTLCLCSMTCFFTGCATYWYQEDKSFDECKSDRAECFTQLKEYSDFANPTVEYEIKYMNDCMSKKGYKEVPQDKLPLDAKRQEPESSFHWRARGLAGSLQK